MLAASASFVAMNALTAALGRRGVPWELASFARASVGFIVALAIARARGVSLSIENHRVMWTRSFAGSTSMLLTFFFMSVMFPTIFALGIHGLGPQSKKKASAFIVMSITGGALMPKFMGWLGDVHDMAAGFWMPLGCFALIAIYAFAWPRLRK